MKGVARLACIDVQRRETAREPLLPLGRGDAVLWMCAVSRRWRPARHVGAE